MTALEACDKIQEAIDRLAPDTVDAGWDWSYGVPQSSEKHVENFAESLRKTSDHFKLEGDSVMWWVSTHETGAILAMCGNSPTSEARANYISWCKPKNLLVLIERIRHLEREAVESPHGA